MQRFKHETFSSEITDRLVCQKPVVHDYMHFVFSADNHSLEKSVYFQKFSTQTAVFLRMRRWEAAELPVSISPLLSRQY